VEVQYVVYFNIIILGLCRKCSRNAASLKNNEQEGKYCYDIHVQTFRVNIQKLYMYTQLKERINFS
jgi:hypothetical protein